MQFQVDTRGKDIRVHGALAATLPVKRPTTPFAQARLTAEPRQSRAQNVVDGRAATALKEYGDQIGATADYSTTKISSDPPLTKASLTFNGETFTGHGRNKKLAQHQAAAIACETLNIAVH